MIVLYTTPHCHYCNKARSFLKENGLPYIEKNILSHRLTYKEIAYLIRRTLNGTDDIIVRNSRPLREDNLSVDDMRLSELISYTLRHPSILKKPILVDNHHLQVGYDPEQLTIFKRAEHPYLTF